MMKITYYGHSCFLVRVNNKNLLFDPSITSNALASHIDVNSIKADYILVSHGHNDHIEDASLIAKNNNATIISNFEIIEWFARQGFKNLHSMNIGGKCNFDFGSVKFLNAVHSSSLPDGSYGGNPCGFLIESNQGNFYFAGDTGLTYDFKLIGEYKKINFAFLPIGDIYTMGIDNAIIASDFIKCNKIIGMHYDTFPAIKINKIKAVDKFERAGKELILLKIGESINI